MISFFVPLIPTAKGRPRSFYRPGLGVRAYTPKETEQAETTFSSLARPYAPPGPLQGPLELKLMFLLPIPKSWPKWKRELGGWSHDIKPDLDNLAKLVLDAFQRSGAWWRDDSQVCRLGLMKLYTNGTPGTHVELNQVEQPTRPQRRTAKSVGQPALFEESK